MGYGSYKASDWTKLKNSRGISSSSGAGEIFSNNQFKEKYDPRFISVRESRDSEDSPNSTPVILAFDVTGSMGYLAAEIAKNSLNKTALELYEKRPVSDPHLMCAAITSPDAQSGLQVTQFEADIRIVEQLLELKVGFGGNLYSFDSMVWYFAAEHTSIDCYEKRGKKGFLFTIGDEVCGVDRGERLTAREIKEVYNDDVDHDFSLAELYRMASEKYEIFHIVAKRESSMKTWERFISGRVAYVSEANAQYLSEVITSIMQITNGMNKSDAVAQWSEDARPVVQTAVSTIDPSKPFIYSGPKPVEAPKPQPVEAPKPQPVQAQPKKESKLKAFLSKLFE
ncbi:MAG: hypothetical protein IJO64_04145 [Clostridia bacterium]|nr:hypothetical protein [Clostridia bacterium]